MTGKSRLVGWDELIGQWNLLEFDFTHLLHMRLERELRRRSFRWFAVHVSGLLGVTDSQGQPLSLIGKFFAQQTTE